MYGSNSLDSREEEKNTTAIVHSRDCADDACPLKNRNLIASPWDSVELDNSQKIASGLEVWVNR